LSQKAKFWTILKQRQRNWIIIDFVKSISGLERQRGQDSARLRLPPLFGRAVFVDEAKSFDGVKRRALTEV
jgi:hypothetical protein